MLAVLSSLDRCGCGPLRPRAQFSLIEFKLVFVHPVFHVRNTDFSFSRNLAEIGEKGGFLQLGVICIFVVVKLFLNGVRERLSVHGEQNGAQYRPLGDSRLKWNRF